MFDIEGRVVRFGPFAGCHLIMKVFDIERRAVRFGPFAGCHPPPWPGHALVPPISTGQLGTGQLGTGQLGTGQLGTGHKPNGEQGAKVT